MTPVESVLSKLSDARRNGSGWSAKCPAHDDRKASLSIGEGADGRALLRCHAGCPVETIISSIGLTLADLMPENGNGRHQPTTPQAASKPTRTFKTAAEAVAELERMHGPRAALWTYHDAEGVPRGCVIRWDQPDGSKDIRPVSRNGSGQWYIGAMSRPRPVYDLPTIRDSGPETVIWVCEGEKAADAATSIGPLTTTSAGGSQAARITDWTPLAGRSVVILPDNDPAGAKYAADVADILAKLNPPAVVKVVDLPDLAVGGDVFDYIAARRAAGADDATIRSAIEQLAREADVVRPDQPEPRPQWRPLPTHALPQPIRAFVEQGAATMRCDPSYIALPTLAALASAVGNSRRLQLRRTWSEPSILWCVIVGESGTVKSPALELALRPIRERQRRMMKDHAAHMEKYEADKLQYEKQLSMWRRDKRADDPPDKSEEPIADRCYCDDTTIEALAVLLHNQPRGLLLARDELSGWLSFDRYAQTKGGDVAKYLEMHAGRSLVVDRRTSGMIYVPRAALSITGSIQPEILRRALGNQHFENGLAARLLLTTPPRRVKRWAEADLPEHVERAVERVFDRLYELQPDHGEDGDPRPRLLRLTPGARAAWVQFYNEHADEQVDLVGDLSAAWSKLEGYTARLALVLHLVRWAAGDPTVADPDAVDEASIAAGVELVRWFGNEAVRAYAALGECKEDREQRDLVTWIRGRGDVVTPRDLAHGLRRFKGKTEDAHKALEELVKAGLGRWVSQTAGGRPSLRFELVPGVPETPVRDRVPSVPVPKRPGGAIENKAFGDGDSGDGSEDGTFGDAPDDGCEPGELPPLTEADVTPVVEGDL